MHPKPFARQRAREGLDDIVCSVCQMCQTLDTRFSTPKLEPHGGSKFENLGETVEGGQVANQSRTAKVSPKRVSIDQSKERWLLGCRHSDTGLGFVVCCVSEAVARPQARWDVRMGTKVKHRSRSSDVWGEWTEPRDGCFQKVSVALERTLSAPVDPAAPCVNLTGPYQLSTKCLSPWLIASSCGLAFSVANAWDIKEVGELLVR